MKKLLYPLALALALGLMLAACAKTPTAAAANTPNEDAAEKTVLVGSLPTEFPLTKDGETLNILITGYGNIDQKDVLVWEKYAEMTGVAVNWTTVKKAERAEAVAAALQNRKNVGLILRCKISSTRLTQYGENGLILDLAKDDLLKNNAPNCWAYLVAHPETLASVMNPDGTIYALPQVNSGAELRVSRKIFINKNWLENVHMRVPKTTGELYTLLKAFKEQDANGNGDMNDEIPPLLAGLARHTGELLRGLRPRKQRLAQPDRRL